MTERGPVVARFEESASELRVLARVRTIAGLLALAGASALLLGRLPLPVFLVALLAALISLAWLAQGRRAHRAAQQKPAVLRVHAQGLACEDAKGETWIAWSDVERVEVDEERLDIVLFRRDAPPFRLEPRYAGVDLYSLVHTLDEARHSAQRP